MVNDSTIIVSWTLANESAAALHAALRSAARLADAALVVWTGQKPSPLGAIPDVAGKCQVHRRYWPWRNDYAAARNCALEITDRMLLRDVTSPESTAWGVMVDSDETMICPDPLGLRAWLASLPPHIAVALAHSADGSHTRERFFRLPARYRFRGRAHEAFGAPIHEQAIVPRELVLWTELPKSEDQLRAKFERDIAMLREDIADDPKDGRAWFYIGTTLQALGRFEEAIEALREFHKLDTWEGGAWGCYRAAECYLALGQPDRAIDAALAGMARDAGIAELPWIAAVASLQVGRLEQARCWAELAKVHALGSEAERRRVGFRLPRGLTTGPGEVLEAARHRKIT